RRASTSRPGMCRMGCRIREGGGNPQPPAPSPYRPSATGSRMSDSFQRRPCRVRTNTTGLPVSSWTVAVKRDSDSKRCSAPSSGRRAASADASRPDTGGPVLTRSQVLRPSIIAPRPVGVTIASTRPPARPVATARPNAASGLSPAPAPASRTMRSASCALRLLRSSGKSTWAASACASRAWTASPMARMVMYGPAAVQASRPRTSAAASQSHFFMVVVPRASGASLVLHHEDPRFADRMGDVLVADRRMEDVAGFQDRAVLRAGIAVAHFHAPVEDDEYFLAVVHVPPVGPVGPVQPGGDAVHVGDVDGAPRTV